MATIADTIRASLAEGKTNEQVLADVKAAHPTANTSAACVSYYRSKMKKAGTATAKPEPKAIAKAVAAVSGNPSYTVKGVKSFIGNEGHGFNATLYRDGKAVAFVYDDASGGPVAFEWKDRDGGLVEVETRTHDGRPWTVKMTHEERAYHTFVSAMPKQSFEGMELDVTMDIHVSDLVNDALLLKDVARMTKGKVAFIKADGKLYTAKCEPTEKNIAAIKAKHVGCVVLNGMGDLAVLAAMRALA
ncbi:MAG: hypothetical protein ABFD96_11450 [Armatimonadia bacterium]